jgi:hypothetical protein
MRASSCLIFGQNVTWPTRFIHRRTSENRYAFAVIRAIRESAASALDASRRAPLKRPQAGTRLR